jgi:small subunit ribosomal protein S16
MVLRIRLARFGQAHKPIYNIVLAQAKSARDSKPLEVLGVYDPLPKTSLASPDTPEYITDPVTGQIKRDAEGRKMKFEGKKYKDIKLDRSRVKYWLGVGAQPTEGVERILAMVRFSSFPLVLLIFYRFTIVGRGCFCWMRRNVLFLGGFRSWELSG